jgi:23S rRNA pseudouridine1911/1915/1917 synthase
VSGSASDPYTRLLVTPELDGRRIDLFLAEITGLSRRAARRLMAEGVVWRNGEVLRVQSRSVNTGDVVDVLRSATELGVSAVPAIEAPHILFEDRWLLIAAKPAGVLSQPAEGDSGGHLAFDEQVLLALALREGRHPFIRLLHRLDRTTSGAVLFAREAEILPALTKAWSGGAVERRYLGIIEGHPDRDTDTIDRPIARDPHHRWRFRCHDAGRSASTEVEVLARLDDDLAVVGCRLNTGRTHQVRVHLADTGHPILGDRLYGSSRADEVNRPLLHAHSIALSHPITGDPLRVVCPPPEDLQNYLPDNLDLSPT